MIKSLVTSEIERVYTELTDKLDILKEKSNNMSRERGIYYFVKRAEIMLIKLENLTLLNKIVNKMEFKYYPNMKTEAYVSSQGIYCNGKELFYTDKLLDIDDDLKTKIIIEEIIYSMLKTSPKASKVTVEKIKADILLMYVVMGLARSEDTKGVQSLKNDINTLYEEIKPVDPNKEAIKRRHVTNKTEKYIEYYKIEPQYSYYKVVKERHYTKGFKIYNNKIRYKSMVKQEIGNMFIDRNKLINYIE